jgi:hypothetical protein
MEKEPKFKVGDEVIFYNEYHGIIKKCRKTCRWTICISYLLSEKW